MRIAHVLSLVRRDEEIMKGKKVLVVIRSIKRSQRRVISVNLSGKENRDPDQDPSLMTGVAAAACPAAATKTSSRQSLSLTLTPASTANLRGERRARNNQLRESLVSLRKGIRVEEARQKECLRKPQNQIGRGNQNHRLLKPKGDPDQHLLNRKDLYQRDLYQSLLKLRELLRTRDALLHHIPEILWQIRDQITTMVNKAGPPQQRKRKTSRSPTWRSPAN